jgi:hypothetical protein
LIGEGLRERVNKFKRRLDCNHPLSPSLFLTNLGERKKIKNPSVSPFKK